MNKYFRSFRYFRLIFLVVLALLASYSLPIDAQDANKLLLQVVGKFNNAQSMHFKSKNKFISQTGDTIKEEAEGLFKSKPGKDIFNANVMYSIIFSEFNNYFRIIYDGNYLIRLSKKDSIAKVFDYNKVPPPKAFLEPITSSGYLSYLGVIRIMERLRKDTGYFIINDSNYCEILFKLKKRVTPLRVYKTDSLIITYRLKIDKQNLAVAKYTQQVERKNGIKLEGETIFEDIKFNDTLQHFDNSIPDSYKIEPFMKDPNLKDRDSVANFLIKPYGKDQYAMKSLKGKVVVLEFTSLNCGACKVATPFINWLDSAYANKNVKIISCYLKATPELLAKEKCQKRNDVVLNDYGLISYFSIQGYPTYIFIDKEGVVYDYIMGYTKSYEKKMINMIETLIKGSKDNPFIPAQKLDGRSGTM